MKKVNSVEEYIELNSHFSEALTTLRALILSTELNESIKWNAPVYDLNGKNVVGLGAFKHHFGIWFFNGVFLKDEQKLLVAAQDKTKGLRQMRFTSADDINSTAVLQYVKEAIENQKLGKEIKITRTKKRKKIPVFLEEKLNKNTSLQQHFNNLSMSKQNEYIDYIDSAKQEKTKLSRLEKIIPMIENEVGLNDKYKNC
ncbi:MAG: DUF1801 domain-containing protein [Winogradskyella sp.]|nr:DUF1801 domain-containing protein [Winogradskyella sp.]